MIKSLFICPHCKAPLVAEEKSCFCTGDKRHCFDISAEGYVNLAPPGASGGGDDAVLIAARRAFLRKGHYQPIAEKITELLQTHAKGKILLDAGCGEGYYTEFFARNGFDCFGVDLSRRGIKSAARSAKNADLTAQYAVAGIFSLPFADASVDAVVSIFAPVSESEFFRVLKKDGILITVGAGSKHLFSLKGVLYDEVYENKARADEPKQERIAKEDLNFQMELSGEDARNLFTMTPYYYRTPKAGHERLAALTHLTTFADVRLSVYRKAGDK